MYIDHFTSVMLASLLGTSQKVFVTFVVSLRLCLWEICMLFVQNMQFVHYLIEIFHGERLNMGGPKT